MRRQREKRQNFQFAFERRTTYIQGVIVWSAILYGRRSPIVFIENVLQPVLIPYVNSLQNPIFQQNNVHSHTVAITKKYLERAQ
ncbi:hypothetical protein BDFB_013342, partial [Asbolus verrucosus]